ncbi:MAG TPA: hypothetical protein VJP80_08685, partial [Candidatus Saccharimonadales bacterium]|nr:hypothetical protein [Candidatus Saccharimonadales bacterium]
ADSLSDNGIRSNILKRILSAIFSLALLVAVATSAHATAWTNPAGASPGPAGQNNTNFSGASMHGGYNQIGSQVMSNIGKPSAPTMITNGTAGSTTLTYACVAFDYNGNQTIPSSTATDTTANATLTATNSVSVTCGGQKGALGYLILKADTSHVAGYCYAKSNTSCTFIDTGTYVNGDGTGSGSSTFTYTAQTVDQTGGNACSGQVVVSAGAAEITAPCVGLVATGPGSSYCSCSYAGTSTPVAGDQCGCYPTSTATVLGGATVTVGAVQVLTASTPATSPIINWWAGPK